MANRQLNEKYRYFEPIGKVEEFLAKVGSGDYFVCLFSAANGVGKTTAMVNTLAHLFFPCDNPYFDYPIFKEGYFSEKVCRVASDPTTIRQTIVPMLEEWFPAGRYTHLKKGKNYPYEWKTDTGWMFDLMTYDQGGKEFESATLSFAFFDEPPPHNIFTATVARMRKGGVIMIWATPLMGSAWMYDEIVVNENREEGYRMFHEAEVEDACIDHGVRGFLKHDDILRMIAQYDDEDMQARVFGKFQHLTGLVFKNWKKDVHVIDPFEVRGEDFVVVNAYDTHPRVEEAILWVAFDRKGRCFVVDELWEKDLPTDQLVPLIKKKDEKYRVVKWLLDPSAFVMDKRRGERNSYAEVLNGKYGMNYVPGSKRRADARKLISDRLSYQVEGGEFIRSPMLYSFSTCTRFNWEMGHYQWDDWRGSAVERKDPKPTTMDKDDHMIEDLGRALLDEPVFEDLVGEVSTSVSGKRGADINDDPFYT